MLCFLGKAHDVASAAAGIVYMGVISWEWYSYQGRSADRTRSDNNKSFRLRVFLSGSPPGQPGVGHGPVRRLLEVSGKPINQLAGSGSTP